MNGQAVSRSDGVLDAVERAIIYLDDECTPANVRTAREILVESTIMKMPCPKCSGTGMRLVPNHDKYALFDRKSPCRTCKGTGKIPTPPEQIAAILGRDIEASKKNGIVQGIAFAVAFLIRAYDMPTLAGDLALNGGLRSISELEKAGVDDYDIQAIRGILPDHAACPSEDGSI